MPYKIQKVRNKNCYKVIAIKSGKLMSKCTTKEKAILFDCVCGIGGGSESIMGAPERSSLFLAVIFSSYVNDMLSRCGDLLRGAVASGFYLLGEVVYNC